MSDQNIRKVIEKFLKLLSDDPSLLRLKVDVTGSSVTIDAGDLEVGAVELKDRDSNTRADIEADGIKNALYIQSNSLAKESTLSSLLTKLPRFLTDSTGTALATATVGAEEILKVQDVAGGVANEVIIKDSITGDKAKVNTSGELLVSGAGGGAGVSEHPEEKFTDAGSAFAVVDIDIISMEQNIIIRNGSTKIVKIERIMPIGVTAGNYKLEIFASPIESGGTVLSAVNRRVGNATSSTTTIIKNSTISDKGSLLFINEFPDGREHNFDIPLSIQIEPNQKLLIVHSSTANETLHNTIWWVEE